MKLTVEINDSELPPWILNGSVVDGDRLRDLLFQKSIVAILQNNVRIETSRARLLLDDAICDAVLEINNRDIQLLETMNAAAVIEICDQRV